MEKLTGLWKQRSKNETTYYSGKVGNTRIMLFKNDKGDNDRKPDLQLSLAKVDDSLPWTELVPDESGKRAAAEASKRNAENFDDLDDEIPF